MTQNTSTHFVDCCKKIFWANLRPRITCLLPGFEMVKLERLVNRGLKYQPLK